MATASVVLDDYTGLSDDAIEDLLDHVDDDKKYEHFLQWLPAVAPSHRALDAVLATLSPQRPFAVRFPDGDHCFGVTWDSSSERVTACAHAAIHALRRTYQHESYLTQGFLPNMSSLFHQGGSDRPSGWQYWEALGSTDVLGMLVYTALAEWLPAKVAEMIDNGHYTHLD